ncbi:unnamed protein product [Eruca vesicaria subsp. sativa]|uniref:DNA primase n=1 Tax=Eruca vesicaria subsp. sativa TaxID=29727 RepID=A0ABC8L1D4_ERUVS|nr:unnamed protein product [Eruca vesicaria subsp. sativa]
MTREETRSRGDDGCTTKQQPKPEDFFNVHYLRIFYGKFAMIYSSSSSSQIKSLGFVVFWLSNGIHPGCDEYFFGRREFSFTLEHDVYLPYKSFKTASALEDAIKFTFPYKIDIGAVYTDKRHAYSQTGTNVFTPVERELVFDILYYAFSDDVRYCCSGADVCSKCWKVIYTSLTEDFGFKHILWVFSGRRGVHCWFLLRYEMKLCVIKSCRMTKEQRSAVAEYFRVYKGFFEGELQANQSIFSSKDKYEKILEMILDEGMQSVMMYFSSLLEVLLSPNLILVTYNGLTTDIQSDLREKWENSARSSLSEEAISLVRWEQLKNTLQSIRCVIFFKCKLCMLSVVKKANLSFTQLLAR